MAHRNASSNLQILTRKSSSHLATQNLGWGHVLRVGWAGLTIQGPLLASRVSTAVESPCESEEARSETCLALAILRWYSPEEEAQLLMNSITLTRHTRPVFCSQPQPVKMFPFAWWAGFARKGNIGHGRITHQGTTVTHGQHGNRC